VTQSHVQQTTAERIAQHHQELENQSRSRKASSEYELRKTSEHSQQHSVYQTPRTNVTREVLPGSGRRHVQSERITVPNPHNLPPSPGLIPSSAKTGHIGVVEGESISKIHHQQHSPSVRHHTSTVENYIPRSTVRRSSPGRAHATERISVSPHRRTVTHQQ
jgi:hypothetical protein